MTRLARALAIPALLLSVLTPQTAPAAGQAAPAVSAPAPVAPAANATFGIQPATPTAADTSRSQIQIGATRGAVVHDQVAISNYGTTALTLRVYASDAFNTPDGGFDLLAAAQRPVDIGAWTVLPAATVTIPARGRVIVPFTVTLPTNVTPGDHVGGIVASLTTTQTDATGNKVAVDQRVGVRIYLRVPGLLRATLSVEELHGEFHAAGALTGGSATISFVVRNTGNVRLVGHQQLSLSSPLWTDITVPSLPDLPELLPGASLRRTLTLNHVPPAGLLTADVRVDPQAVGTDLNPTMISVRRHTTFWALNWVSFVVLGLLLLLAIAIVLIVLLIRRRRRDGRTPVRPVVRRDHADAAV